MQSATHATDVPPAALVSSSRQAVGMTPAELTQWLAATRDTSRPTPAGTELTAELPSHSQPIERRTASVARLVSTGRKPRRRPVSASLSQFPYFDYY